MVAVDLPGQSGFRVEEVEVFVDVQLLHSRSGGSPVVLVVQSVYLVVDVAVLQVEVGAEAAYQFIIGFQINIAVILCGVVAVVVVVGVQFADIVLYPKHFSKVVAVIAIQCTA